MQEASITGFFRTIFIILIIILLVRYVTRVFMPYILQYLVNRSQEHINKKFQDYEQQNNGGYQNQKTEPEKKKEQVGEYIDFEEID